MDHYDNLRRRGRRQVFAIAASKATDTSAGQYRYDPLHDFTLVQPPTTLETLYYAHPLLGITCFNQQENNPSGSVAELSHKSLSLQPPLIQAPGSMLGAKARAAEYHAAKAASARQQAIRSPEEHQLPPKPTAMSLSTFTKNHSFNRNKGNKIFKPLVLSEDDERSASSVEPGGTSPRSLSPLPDPLPDPIGHRAASLPPPHTANNMMETAEQNIQTPFRYKTSSYIPSATRTYNPDHVLQYIPQGAIPVPCMPYLQNMPPVSHQMARGCHQAWYYPPDNGLEGRYAPVGVLPSDPLNNPQRPPLRHNETHFSNPEANKRVFEAVYAPSKPELAQTQPLEKEQQDENAEDEDTEMEVRYVFHPDHVTPTKIEFKDKYRKEWCESESAALQTMPQKADGADVRTPESSKIKLRDEILPSNENVRHIEQSEEVDKSFSTRTEHPSSNPYPCRSGADWPHLGVDADTYKKPAETPTRQSITRLAGKDEVCEAEDHFSRLLLGSILDGQPRESQIRPPPGLEHMMMADDGSNDSVSEETSSFDFPTTNVHTEEWCEVRVVSAKERRFTRDLMKNAALSLTPKKYFSSYGNGREVRQKGFEEYLDCVKQGHASRRARVNDLAKEMQMKWEYGGHYRYPSMNAKDAKVHAGTVKAVASILSTLNSAAKDSNGLHLLGSRPYRHPPEYAIDRDSGSKQAGTHRQFESSGEINQPLRLARDPRFRQLGDDMKPRPYEERIPRMFAAHRRL